MMKGEKVLDKINVSEKLSRFNDLWSPKIVSELNDSFVKLVKLEGEFVWHKHDQEDEMFFVIEGQLVIKFRDKDIVLNPNEFIVIPKGVEHKPVADNQVMVMLIESKSTINTGDKTNDKTVLEMDWI